MKSVSVLSLSFLSVNGCRSAVKRLRWLDEGMIRRKTIHVLWQQQVCNNFIQSNLGPEDVVWTDYHLLQSVTCPDPPTRRWLRSSLTVVTLWWLCTNFTHRKWLSSEKNCSHEQKWAWREQKAVSHSSLLFLCLSSFTRRTVGWHNMYRLADKMLLGCNMIESNDLMFVVSEIKTRNKSLWGRWACNLNTVGRKCNHVKIFCGQHLSSGLSFVLKWSKNRVTQTLWRRSW